MFKQTIFALLVALLVAAVSAAPPIQVVIQPSAPNPSPANQVPITSFCTTVVFIEAVYDPVADTTTFHYRVSVPLPQNCPAGTNTKDLSHWVLQICPELVPFIVSTNPPALSIGKDPSTPINMFGIKWGPQVVGTVVDYFVTFSGRLDVGTTQYLIKNQDYGVGNIAGPVCGALNIFKYNDLNANGLFDAGEPGLNGWQFTVKDSNGNIVCSITTAASTVFATPADGYGVCDNLPSGTYTITEVLQSGWQNTDPGTSLTKTINYVKGSSPTIRFGNTCQMSITFRVCGIPDYFTTQLQLIYSRVSGPPLNYPPVPVNMVLDPNTHCATATVSNQFTLASVISWGVQAAGLGSVILVQSQSFTSCVQTVTALLPLTPVVSHKYKDISQIGVYEPGVDIPLEGFQFTLTRQGSPNFNPTFTSDANGLIDLGTLAAGVYVLTETVPTGWQVSPANGQQTFTVLLSDTNVVVDPFLDTPFTNLDIQVTSPSGFTQGKISCTTADGQQFLLVSNHLTLTNLLLSASPIQCTIALSDP